MRTSLLPHLYDVLSYNINRKNANVHVYEMGSIFHTNESPLNTQPEEQEYLAAALTGTWQENKWQARRSKLISLYLRDL